MDAQDIADYRLSNQLIPATVSRTPSQVVASLGALQAQAYQDSLWAVGLRCKDATQSDVEGAVADRSIVRTWAMRGTWHFVSPGETRWFLSLYPEDVNVPSYMRRVGLTEPSLRKGLALIPTFFKKNGQLTYAEMGDALKATGIPSFKDTMAQRHVIRRAGRMGIICFSGHIGRQPAFSLLESHVPKSKPMSRADVLARFAEVYFKSHGPATDRDFAWWAGVKLSDARAGVNAASSHLSSDEFAGQTYWMPKNAKRAAHKAAYLLPSFDEYIIAYQNRDAVLEPRHAKKIINGSTLLFHPTVVFDGKVIGAWKRANAKGAVQVSIDPFNRLSGVEKEAIDVAAEHYGRFLGMKVSVK